MGDCGTSVRQLCETTAATDHYSVGDVPDLTADPALAEKELGFVATEDLDAMCRDLWNFQTKNARGYEA